MSHHPFNPEHLSLTRREFLGRCGMGMGALSLASILGGANSLLAEPAVAGGFVYTAAEDGYVYCFRQSNGEPVWKFKAEGGLSKNYTERSGIWASPIVVKDRIYIGSNNGYMYCLTADKGQVVWQQLMPAPIWGTSPVVDDRLVFGDKFGWIHMLSAHDGKTLGELKIGENINSTPAVVGGRIYIGAFNGKLHCLRTKPGGWEELEGMGG